MSNTFAKFTLNNQTLMEIKLGDVLIQLKEKKSISSSGIGSRMWKGKISTSTLNCIFSKGFKRGNGSRETKNFYFYHQEGSGLIFKGGMIAAPQEMIDYMEYLKSEYAKLELTNDNISIEDFLAHLVYNRRSQIINGIIE